MKNKKNKVLLFPTPPKEPEDLSIFVQIGSQRFVIRYAIEDLPPVEPPIFLGRRPTRQLEIVK